MTENMGVTAEELEDLAWALYDAFPEVAREVNPAHNPDFWPAKATALLPVINKIRDRARKEGANAMAFATTGEGESKWDDPDPDDPPATKDDDPMWGHEITLDEALEKRHEGD